jgi:hypothetical protein
MAVQLVTPVHPTVAGSESNAAAYYMAAGWRSQLRQGDSSGLLHVQHPLLQLAERCRVLVDADVANMRRRAASSHQESGPCNPISVWAVPLGMVMQVRQTPSPGSGSCAPCALACLVHVNIESCKHVPSTEQMWMLL